MFGWIDISSRLLLCVSLVKSDLLYTSSSIAFSLPQEMLKLMLWWAAESNDADKTIDEKDSAPVGAEKQENCPSKPESGQYFKT